MTTKVRKSLTLDPDVVAVFEDDVEGLSAAVNLALRETVVRRARQRELEARVAELDALFGPSRGIRTSVSLTRHARLRAASATSSPASVTALKIMSTQPSSQ